MSQDRLHFTRGSVDEAAVLVDVMGQTKSHSGADDDVVGVGWYSSALLQAQSFGKIVSGETCHVHGLGTSVSHRQEGEVLRLTFDVLGFCNGVLDVGGPFSIMEEVLYFGSTWLL